MDDQKAKLRDELRARRRARDATEQAHRSGALADRLETLGRLRQARSLAAFVGVRGEPDTSAFLRAWLGQGRELWLPRIHGRGLMTFERVRDLDDLVEGPMGLLEPVATLPDGDPTWRDRVEVVLVPGLGFDRSGARLGQGGGFYDRALKPLGKRDPLRVGICFADELLAEGVTVPTEEHDARVHVIVTDEGVLEIR